MFLSPAFAQVASGAATGGPTGATAFFVQFAPLVLIFVIFWFLLIRPQQQRQKAHRAMIDAVKRGDQVVTGGGLMGKVVKVEDAVVEIEIAPNVRVRAVKGTLTDVTPMGGGKPAND